MTEVMQLLIVATVLHPSHQTLAEVEWNGDTGRMEVALMFDVLDEQWIERHHGGGVGESGAGAGTAGDDFDGKGDDWRLRYLRRHFRFSADREGVGDVVTADQDRAGEGDSGTGGDRYLWVGRKQDGGHVWWFFEVSLRDEARPRSVTSRVLFDRDDRYLHRVVVLGSKPRRVLELTPDRPSGELPAVW